MASLTPRQRDLPQRRSWVVTLSAASVRADILYLHAKPSMFFSSKYARKHGCLGTPCSVGETASHLSLYSKLKQYGV